MKRRRDASLKACDPYFKPRVNQEKSRDGTSPERAKKKENPRYSQSNTNTLNLKLFVDMNCPLPVLLFVTSPKHQNIL
jgi:hypothetical protein